MRETKLPPADTMLSMEQVARRKLIPWATTRTSVRKLFQKRSGLRYFVAGHQTRKRFITTLAWVEAYKAKVQRTK